MRICALNVVKENYQKIEFTVRAETLSFKNRLVGGKWQNKNGGVALSATPTCVSIPLKFVLYMSRVSVVTCAEEVVSYSSKLPDQSTYDFNTTVVYTCEPGYEHSSGNLSITCMDSGSWSGPAPVCTSRST